MNRSGRFVAHILNILGTVICPTLDHATLRSPDFMPESPVSSDIAAAAEILRRGGLVAIPTETVYGLGANAFDVAAVARVFEVKGRPHFDPLIVHVADISQVRELAREFPAPMLRLAKRFWPGPLTLVLPKTDRVPDLVTSGGPTVAIRIPDHPLTLSLLREVKLPIAAPSANPFGRISPTTAQHVRDQLGDKLDLILDGGPCRVGVESTVVQWAADGLHVLRPGGVSVEELEDFVDDVHLPPSRCEPSDDDTTEGETGSENPLASPGTLLQHYAPRTPLTVVASLQSWLREQSRPGTQPMLHRRLGLLTLKPVARVELFEKCEVLSESGDLREAAANFFAALRRLDAAGLDLIVAEDFPMQGLGRALNDRLTRAAHT